MNTINLWRILNNPDEYIWKGLRIEELGFGY